MSILRPDPDLFDVAAWQARLAELRHELGDADPPGPAPVAAGCRDGARVPA